MKRRSVKGRALEIMEKFQSARVLVVGDIIMDQFIWGKVSRISPEAPVPVVDIHTDNHLLGGAANVMNNMFCMGGKPCLAGVVGADDAGNLLLRKIREMNIDQSGIIIESSRPTTLKTRIIAHGQQMVRFDRESRRAIEETSEDGILAYIEREIDRGLGAIVISDYNKGLVTDRLLQGIRQKTAGKKIFVCVDPKRNDFSFYEGFDIITPNHYEAARALGILDNESGMDVVNLGNELLERYKFQAVLITRGEEGMSLFEKDGKIIHTPFPAEAKEVFDVTGAGDTVIGVFALALASGAAFQEAAYLANHAAGIVVAKLGTATVTPRELKKKL